MKCGGDCGASTHDVASGEGWVGEGEADAALFHTHTRHRSGQRNRKGATAQEYVEELRGRGEVVAARTRGVGGCGVVTGGFHRREAPLNVRKVKVRVLILYSLRAVGACAFLITPHSACVVGGFWGGL